MYENIKSCVKLDNQSSSFFASECGVRQGENLSPLLFSLYSNDLESFLLSGGVKSLELEVITQELHIYLKLLLLLYADDTVIFSNDKENFQTCLDTFYEYCIMWKLNINFDKTKIVIFNSKSTNKSRKENPQKQTQFSSRSHPRHLVGKRTAQKTPS